MLQDPKTIKAKATKEKRETKKILLKNEKKFQKKKIKEKLFIKKQKTLTNTNTSRPMHFDTDRRASKLRERKVDWSLKTTLTATVHVASNET